MMLFGFVRFGLNRLYNAGTVFSIFFLLFYKFFTQSFPHDRLREGRGEMKNETMSHPEGGGTS